LSLLFDMRQSIQVHFSDEVSPLKEEIDYLLRIVTLPYKNAEVEYVDIPNDHTISIGALESHNIQVSLDLIRGTLKKDLLNKNCFFESAADKKDYLSTAFFMLTMSQEFHDNDPDILGRFKYANSYQSRFGNSKDNIVQECLSKLRKTLGLETRDEPTSFMLSHDIDMVRGAIIEDGFNALKKGRIDIMMRLLVNVAIGRPDWLNMDKILNLESEYDCRSVFFWIVNKGTINKREKNADYDFKSPAIQRHFKNIASSGFENGLHKSISNESFQEEFQKFGSIPLSNRYHYLKFKLPQAFEDIEQSGRKLDASLGFAEEPGFRNSYGLPYNPYNFKKRKPFTFVEAPLHIMDRTYFQYKKFSPAEAEKDIIGFFERNKYNCVISILWHNNFFTNYKFKGYLPLYKAILTYIYENKFKTISSQEIIRKYSIA
jgi:hypothetical protein